MVMDPFVGRSTELSLLDSPKNIVILGEKFSGKTTLVKKYAEKSGSIYVNLDLIGVTPEEFALRLIASTCISLKLNKDSFEIIADTNKGDTDLLQEWGRDILGLTDENLQRLIDKIRTELREVIRQKIHARFAAA